MGLRFLVLGFFIVSGLGGCGFKLGIDPVVLQKSNKMLAITTTNYQSGALALLDIENRLARLSFSPIYSDAIVKSFRDVPDVFVINRLGADNIQRIDRFTGQTLHQFSLGKGTNPQDMILFGKSAYISCLGSWELLNVNLSTGVVKNRIDLKAYSDSDGSPEPAWMALNQNELWLQLQRLDRSNFFAPVGLSQLVIINVDTDQIVGSINLKGSNPVTPFKQSVDGKWLIGEAGWVGSQSKLDGGVELIDPNKKESLGFITTESQLGGDIVDFECVSTDVCIAIISKPETELVLFDPKTGMKINTLWRSAGYHLRQVLRDEIAGLIYVADGDPYEPKIRVWNEISFKQETNLNWNLSLPPYQMTFLK